MRGFLGENDIDQGNDQTEGVLRSTDDSVAGEVSHFKVSKRIRILFRKLPDA